MYRYLLLWSEVSYDLGLIGLAELKERAEVAEWLLDPGHSIRDPRLGRDEEPETQESSECERPDTAPLVEGAKKDDPADRWFHLVVLSKWIFTVGDVDCYPSVPHGHFQKKTNSWPKLNPYTGRVFSAPHSEDKARRLTRREMQVLWNDEEFLNHCHKQIDWYTEFAPQYQFVTAKYGRHHLPRWRPVR
ncbi:MULTISPECIES: hypothetical protein [Pseudomonas]|uniref:hypothetical protein n=1 Tax=Pseudomonas TaxID=286 RepID=UPI000C21C403|nr:MULTISPECIES: hypothetical protein [Pseudomonas]PJH88531.1 hypothetical protein CVG87_12680 [Pseudomonas sp. WCS365]UII13507.1 hypothetical protein LRP86_00362 [Pseudomonas brassicacearum]